MLKLELRKIFSQYCATDNIFQCIRCNPNISNLLEKCLALYDLQISKDALIAFSSDTGIQSVQNCYSVVLVDLTASSMLNVLIKNPNNGVISLIRNEIVGFIQKSDSFLKHLQLLSKSIILPQPSDSQEISV